MKDTPLFIFLEIVESLKDQSCHKTDEGQPEISSDEQYILVFTHLSVLSLHVHYSL